MKILTMCGIPGSGKTTQSLKLAADNDIDRYSFDELHVITYKNFTPHILHSLNMGRSVVADAPYTTKKTRMELIQSINNIPDCKKILIVMNTPFDECVRRNNNRNKQLPISLLESFNRTFEMPSLDEGWDKIQYIG